ncbi:MAG TPA: DUF4157 domain-containing protein [Mizugakiibacter sp.]
MAERTASVAGKAASSAPTAGLLLQRKCACGTHTPGGGECTECARKRLQRKPDGVGAAPAIPPSVHEVLRGSGRPLGVSERTFMESRFHRDFSRVSVHTDAAAAASARAVGALAYTVGNHIVFGGGRYAPSTPGGRHLLAHELAHTVQQGGAQLAFSPQLEVGAADTQAEVEADRVADHVAAGAAAPPIGVVSAPALRRQRDPSSAGVGGDAEPDFSAPQQRGGRGRAGYLDAGQRGADRVRIAIIRYLCNCAGRNVTHTSARARVQPNPGFTLEFCRGSTTVRLNGDVVPSTLTTGRASVGVEVNVAPGQGGTGVRATIEGEARNTGSEPQVGGRGELRVRLPGGQQVGAEGEILRGTQSGQIDTSVGAGVDFGSVRVRVEATNPQDARRGGMVILGGNLPGQQVEDRSCRECRCPTAYQCYEDIPPRDYEVPVTYDVEQRSRLRYYFELDTNHDSHDSVLAGQSRQMLDEVARRVAAGSRIQAITGYASPEDNRERPTPNEQLSLSRARRVHDLLARRLGASAQIPAPAAGGELLGRVATIEPGSRLADAIVDVGFGDPEDVTAFLIGSDIPNPRLSEQFLALLQRITEPADRLRLFGVDASSPAAPRLLAAIQQFVRNRGRGRRPWEGIFGFLRYATVELSDTHPEHGTEQRRTTGSLTPLPDAPCQHYARHAENAGLFGPAEPEPRDPSQCPSGEPHNPAEYDSKCRYD